MVELELARPKTMDSRATAFRGIRSVASRSLSARCLNALRLRHLMVEDTSERES